MAGALAAVVLGEPALAALGAPFAVAAVAGIALARDPRVRVRASVAPERLLEGDEAVVTYDVRADGGAEWLELRPLLPPGLVAEPGAAARVLRLAPGDHRLVDLPVRATRWGGQRRGRRARARHRAGGRRVVHRGRAGARPPVRVLPGIERLRTLVSPARTQAAVGPRRSGARGDGLELAEVRPWVPGDHARRLHWRATARRGEPFVAERHPERAADVLIFVDTFADTRVPARPRGRADPRRPRRRRAWPRPICACAIAWAWSPSAGCCTGWRPGRASRTRCGSPTRWPAARSS